MHTIYNKDRFYTPEISLKNRKKSMVLACAYTGRRDLAYKLNACSFRARCGSAACAFCNCRLSRAEAQLQWRENFHPDDVADAELRFGTIILTIYQGNSPTEFAAAAEKSRQSDKTMKAILRKYRTNSCAVRAIVWWEAAVVEPIAFDDIAPQTQELLVSMGADFSIRQPIWKFHYHFLLDLDGLGRRHCGQRIIDEFHNGWPGGDRRILVEPTWKKRARKTNLKAICVYLGKRNLGLDGSPRSIALYAEFCHVKGRRWFKFRAGPKREIAEAEAEARKKKRPAKQVIRPDQLMSDGIKVPKAQKSSLRWLLSDLNPHRGISPTTTLDTAIATVEIVATNSTSTSFENHRSPQESVRTDTNTSGVGCLPHRERGGGLAGAAAVGGGDGQQHNQPTISKRQARVTDPWGWDTPLTGLDPP